MSPRRCSSIPRSQRWRRPDAHWLNPVGFSFALAGLGQLLIQPFKFLFFGRGWTNESGGPPLFEPSLKVEGDIGHIKASHPVHSGSADFQLGHDLRQAFFAELLRPAQLTRRLLCFGTAQYIILSSLASGCCRHAIELRSFVAALVLPHSTFRLYMQKDLLLTHQEPTNQPGPDK